MYLCSLHLSRFPHTSPYYFVIEPSSLVKALSPLEHKTTTQSGINKREVSWLTQQAVSLQSISKIASFKGTAASRTQLFPSSYFANHGMLVSLSLAPSSFKMVTTKVLRSPADTTASSTKRTRSSSVSLFKNHVPKDPSIRQGLDREEPKPSQNLTEMN